MELDLRKPNERERSKLFHRLALLGIPWAEPRETSGLGTFKEGWRLQRQPESPELVRAALWGNTVEDATVACLRERCADGTLLELTRLAEAALLAALPEALDEILGQLQARAAQGGPGRSAGDAADAGAHLALSRRARHRRLHAGEAVGRSIQRIAIGLPLACASLDDEAAGRTTRSPLPAYQTRNPWTGLAGWNRGRLLWQAARPHGLVSGRAAWLLLEMNLLEASAALTRALSHAAGAAAAAAWVEGFLRHNGEPPCTLQNCWISWIPGYFRWRRERFLEVLLLLRRTFASFPPAVRRNLGESLARGRQVATVTVLSERASWRYRCWSAC